MKLRLRLLLLALLAALALSACSSASEHLWLKSPDWSRGVWLGETGAALPVEMQLRADGAACNLLLPAEGETERVYHFEVVCLLPDGRRQTQSFPFSLKLPRGAAFRLQAEGVRFWWLDGDTLYTALAAEDGTALEAPQPLLDGRPVGNFLLLEDVLLAAGTQRAPGIYVQTADGVVHTLAEDGVWLRATRDAEGGWHLAWVTYPLGYGQSALYYGFRPAAAGWDAVSVQTVTSLPLGLNTRLDSLALGLDDTHLSILWTTSVVSGLEAGTVISHYVSAPLVDGDFSAPQVLTAPLGYDLDFSAPPTGDLQTGRRLDLAAAPFAPTPALEDFYALEGAHTELALAYRASMLHQWRKQRWQVNVLYLDAGQPRWAQLLSFTPSYSLKPLLRADEEGYLYLTWLEKVAPRTYSVYFTSTQPQFVQAQSALTWAERGDLLLQVVFGMLVGALLAPLMGAVWMLAPLFVYLLVHALRRWLPQSWRAWWEYVSLGLALLAFWSAKQATLPAMFTYVPFSAWIPNIPDWLAPLLRWGVPAAILLVSLWTSWYYTYRKQQRAGLYFLLLYIAVDAFWSMAVYAVMIYGVF